MVRCMVREAGTLCEPVRIDSNAAEPEATFVWLKARNEKGVAQLR